MLFTLEALNAKEGDCLLLHYGAADDPRLILVDGGPRGVYARTLEPRLEELRTSRGRESLAIELGMVSHIDADHITGIVDLTRPLVEAHADRQPRRYDFARFWHNSLEAMLGEAVTPAALPGRVATLASTGRRPRGLRIKRDAAVVVASVAQGKELAGNLDVLGVGGNAPFDGPVASGSRLDLEDGPAIRVLGPDAQELEDLRDRWEREVPKDDEAKVAAYLDTTVPNLSSIVCLVEYRGKRILLTGDARGDRVIEGAKAAGLLRGGPLELDILKLPHHGSIRNLDTDFFASFPARHYVISANGANDNPDTATLSMLTETRKDNDWALWFTNRTGRGDLETRLDAFLSARKTAKRSFAVEFREADAFALRVDLEDPLPT